MTTENTTVTMATTTTRPVRFFYMRNGRRTVTVAYRTTEIAEKEFSCEFSFSANRVSNSSTDEFCKKHGRNAVIARLEKESTRHVLTHGTTRDIHLAIAKEMIARRDAFPQAVRETAEVYLATPPKQKRVE